MLFKERVLLIFEYLILLIFKYRILCSIRPRQRSVNSPFATSLIGPASVSLPASLCLPVKWFPSWQRFLSPPPQEEAAGWPQTPYASDGPNCAPVLSLSPFFHERDHVRYAPLEERDS